MEHRGTVDLKDNEIKNLKVDVVTGSFPAAAKGKMVFRDDLNNMFICSQALPVPVWLPLSSTTPYYIHTQSGSSNQWTITHGLGSSAVFVQVYDSSNYQVIPQEILIVDENNVEIQFASLETGTAIFAVLAAPHIVLEGPIEASQVEAETGTEIALRYWSPFRIFQAINAKASLMINMLKTILGQYDTRTDYTPTNGSTTTVNYATGNSKFINIMGLNSGNSITINTTGWPEGLSTGHLEIIFITGSTVPTVTLDGQSLVLTANKEIWVKLVKCTGISLETRIFSQTNFNYAA